ncbi:vacuolar iron transporter homolog 4 [Setaria italica]|uniref:Vacuolar iron transporter n=1 Tax=Setaria italica TaxID=4555 RepID=K3ZNQ2_SETIT|nr:vacuolar iron transporter homolog 4 [Setaria italica]XP_034568600.1 vacuolar iron transporter homolog 4-like [Setaria viridis]
MAATADDDTKLTIIIGPPTAAPGSKETCAACGALPTDGDAAIATTMPSPPPPPSAQRHVQWLRAAVLGASDGLVSTAALMLGVGAAHGGDGDLRAVLLAGLAGLVAGACSMAIGEYVSVHAQLDVELAELKRGGGGPPEPERAAGLPSPGQAAAASALAFASGGSVPLLAAWFVTGYEARVAVVVATATVALAVFGSLGAVLGRAPGGRAGLRAVVGGLVAMGITYGLMKLSRIHGV